MQARQGELLAGRQGRRREAGSVRVVKHPRPQYLNHAWRGAAMADFLIRLRQAAQVDGVTRATRGHFSLEDFIRNLIKTIEKRDPEVLERVSPALAIAEPFLPVLEGLPAGFCHGDFHPANIIWGEDCLKAVIDWEFCGIRPEMYDAALMVGCAGFEYPPGISGDYVGAFLTRLWRSGLFKRESWEHFFPLALLIRLAWLSEWLRNRETAMISLELDYLDFLTSHAQDLTALFSTIC
ncbi:MAG: aminoglycoside phosphotransferase family protein [Desulfatibacillum sp.]|nr:aminoglycoside phosphotransferase family protein [Desulfatibacillum sp.]